MKQQQQQQKFSSPIISMQLLLVVLALLVLAATITIEPVVFVSSFTVSPSSSLSWHHRHAPPPTWRHKKQRYHQQTSIVQLREQEAAAAEATPGEIYVLHQDDDEYGSDNVAALRSVTFHNLPKNIHNDDANENEEEAGPDLLADFLMEIGACSVSLTDADAGTDLESPLFHEPQYYSANIAIAGGGAAATSSWHDSLHWAAPIWNKCNLTAHFPASIDISHVIQLVQETFPQYQLFFPSLPGGGGEGSQSSSMFSIEAVPNRDWVVHVQSSWKPIVVPGGGGGFIISSSSSNFKKFDDNDERRLPRGPTSHHHDSNTLFVLQFPWHSNEDVKRAIQEQQQQQQQQQTAASPPLAVVADSTTALQQQQQQQPNKGGQEEEKTNKKNIVTIQLQGGIAFGTGEHATTQLCLQWLDRVIPRLVQCSKNDDDSSEQQEQQQHDNDDVLRILDYGSGSGILGIAALKLAAAAAAATTSQQYTTTTTTAHAVGIDIDMDACRIANANAIINNVSQFKTFLPPLAKTMDAESKSLLLKARAHAAAQQQQVHNDHVDNNNNNDNCLTMTLPKEQQEQLYDVCVANILAAPLIALAPEIVAMLKPGTGRLGMSGILPQQGQAVVQAYTAAGLEHVLVEQEMGGWILVTGRRAGVGRRKD